MIQISQEEAKYLRDHGCADDVHMSSVTAKSRGKRYYATEAYNVMKLLKKFHDKRTVQVVEPTPVKQGKKGRPNKAKKNTQNKK